MENIDNVTEARKSYLSAEFKRYGVLVVSVLIVLGWIGYNSPIVAVVVFLVLALLMAFKVQRNKVEIE